MDGERSKLTEIWRPARTKGTGTGLKKLILTTETPTVATVAGSIRSEAEALYVLDSPFEFKNKKHRTWAGGVLDGLQVYQRVKRNLDSLPSTQTERVKREVQGLESIMSSIVGGDEVCVQPIMKIIRCHMNANSDYKHERIDGVFNALNVAALAGLPPKEWVTTPLDGAVLTNITRSFQNNTGIAITNSSLVGLFEVLKDERADLTTTNTHNSQARSADLTASRSRTRVPCATELRSFAMFARDARIRNIG